MRERSAAVGLACVVLVVLPFALGEFRTEQLATVGAYFIAILGLDILIGHSGYVSLGHGAFMAIGAYTTATLVGHHGLRDVATIPIAAAVAGGLGLLVGIAAVRLPGVFLALATFGVAVVLPTIVERFDHFTGGSTGISFFGSPHRTGHGSARWAYALTWAIALVLLLLAWWLLSTRFGRGLRAARDSELAAAAAGVPRAAYAVAAFGLSAAYAGVAGALLAIDVAYVSPGSIPVQLSLYLVVGAVMGLYGSIGGAVLGAVLVEFLPDIVAAVPHVGAPEAGPTTFAFGAILVVLTLLLPLVGRARAVLSRRGYPRAR